MIDAKKPLEGITPGKWEIELNGKYYIWAKGNYRDVGIAQADELANAELMAAAPEIKLREELEAAKRIGMLECKMVEDICAAFSLPLSASRGELVRQEDVEKIIEDMRREYWQIPAPVWLVIGTGMDGHAGELNRRLLQLGPVVKEETKL